MRRILLGIALTIHAATAAATPLWQNVKAGMTVEQLVVAQPGTVPIPPSLKDHYISTCTHTSGTITVLSELMDVCYRVVGDKVQSVILHNANLSASPVTFDLIKPTLAAKYGQPVTDCCASVPGGRLCKAVWSTRSITVSATGSVIVTLRSVTISYEIMPDAASQL